MSVIPSRNLKNHNYKILLIFDFLNQTVFSDLKIQEIFQIKLYAQYSNLVMRDLINIANILKENICCVRSFCTTSHDHTIITEKKEIFTTG